MKFPFAKSFKRSLQTFNQWFSQTPERALEQAYDAALLIRAMEDQHFGGQKIEPATLQEGNRIYSYFEDELQSNLRIIKLRLSEFKASRSFLSLSDPRLSGINLQTESATEEEANSAERLAIRLEKLRFVDQILNCYTSTAPALALIPLNKPAKTEPSKPISTTVSKKSEDAAVYPLNANTMARPEQSKDGMSGSTSFVPRSILGTFDRLRRELDPQAEEEVVKTFRSSKTKTVVSLRFILLLILVPLLTHQMSKNFIVGPIVDHFRPETPENLFINIELEEEALSTLERFESRLDFQSLLYNAPQLTREEKSEKIQEKAEEIAQEFYDRSTNAIKNVFSDVLAAIAFVIVMTISKQELEVLKSFIDDIIYGLSDSAKAFIIILFTDMFVGFHSPHGWEVLLEGVSRHFGLPESREFIYLFIATFPVILDTVFKYWIFRYLNRISPSAVATYRNMNE
ncbi:MAG: proton extrusion protein PcxA [Prochlorotrichaceae cyanobacterium]